MKDSRVKRTKEEVYDFVVGYTREFCRIQKLHYDACAIAKELSISRTSASQHLNCLAREGKLIKVLSRPVYYLDKKTLEDSFKVKLDAVEFYDLEELTECFDKQLLIQKDFMAAVGYDTSLNYCISQCQSAVRYPPNGVPILICGEHGVGKSLLATLLYDYARNENVLPEGAKCLFLTYSKINADPFDDVRILFGAYEVKNGESGTAVHGLLHQARDGIVVIDNVERMTSLCLEKIVRYIQMGEYTLAGDNDRVFSSRTRLVFITSENPYTSVESMLLQNIPVICKVPTLDARPLGDKEAIIIKCLREEEKKLRKKIFISSQCFQCLLHSKFRRNVGGLVSCIKTLCTNAFLGQKDDTAPLNIYLYHMPEDILSSVQSENTYENAAHSMIEVETYKATECSDFILSFFDRMLNIFDEYKSNNLTLSQTLKECTNSMNLYYDYIVFEKKYSNERVEIIEKLVAGIFNSVSEIYNIYIPYNCIFVVSRILYTISRLSSEIRIWEEMHGEEIKSMLLCLEQYYSAEFRIANEILERVRLALDIEIDDMNVMFLILNLQFYNKDISDNNCTGIIVSRGYSTASSIADAANKLVGRHVFKSIDIPLDTSAKEEISTINDYIRSHLISQNLLLMVDMESIDDMEELLGDIPNVRLGIINSISTRAAVKIGFQMLQNVELETILRSICDESVCVYKVFDHHNRQNAVLFTAESGMGPTERVIQLFENSLTDKMDIAVLPYDYNQLAVNKEQDGVFRKYNVLFIVGTMKIDIGNIPHVLLENIIVPQDAEMITSIFAKTFSEEEAVIFNKNLIKNFSLENLMRHLTILNPDRLLDFIETAINRLQALLNRSFSNNTIVGLYVHVSCLIEKLVTNSFQAVEVDGNALSMEEKEFVKIFSTSFSELMAHYNVKMPLSEMIYIHGYIMDDA